jgi:hypothetical protein
MSEDKRVAVTLKVSEWNLVAGVLAEGVFRVVAPLIGQIRDQVLAALNAKPPLSDGAMIDASEGESHGLEN